MIRNLSSFLFPCIAAGTLIVSVGCAELDNGSLSSAETNVNDGAQLFNKATFGGNGRTCASCHPSDDGDEGTGTLSPADVEALFQANPNDPLFQHDAADVIGGNTFDRFRAHATVLIEMPLPPNVRIVGSDARSVTLPRGIPTTMNTPALDPVLMYDGRAPNLQAQALGAINGHAQTNDVTDDELDAIAAFQQTLFNRAELEDFAQDGVPVTIPYGNTESEKRGRRFFIADDSDNPDDVGEEVAQACGWCHSGPMLNGLSTLFASEIAQNPLPPGFRFATALTSEVNRLGNPVYDFEFTLPDGNTTTVSSPDPGLALVTGNPGLANIFKTPTVWATSETAPYFHDNSAKNFEELMEQYAIMLFFFTSADPTVPTIQLSAQDKADIIAYMNLL